MKRHLLILLLLLIAGAAVNVAVAWGCALFVDLRGAETEAASRISGHQSWELFRYERPGLLAFASIRGRSIKPLGHSPHGRRHEELLPHWVEFATPTPAFQARTECGALPTVELRQVSAYGWPAPALWYEWNSVRSGDETVWEHFGGGFIRTRLPHTLTLPRVLPLRPIWRAFLLNTLLYAGALWLLFIAPRMARRTVRVRRGRCIACGYPLGEHGTCTECGAPLRDDELQPA